MSQLPNPAEKMQAILRRQHKRFFTVIVPGMALVTGAGVAALQLIPGVAPLWLSVYLAAVFPAGIAALWWTMRHQGRVIVDFVPVASPRILDVGLVEELVIVFDAGIVGRLNSDILRFSMFFNAGGSPLSPTPDEATIWARPTRDLVRVGRVPNKKGPATVEDELNRLKASLGARWASLAIYERRPGRPTSEKGAPARVVASFSVPRLMRRANDVVALIDPTAALIRNVRTPWTDRGPLDT